MKVIKAAAALVLSLSLQARADVLHDVTYNVIVQTYKGLQSSAHQLRDQIEILKADRSQANLEAAQQTWRQMRLEWEATEGFLFGPVSELQIDPNLDSWPLNRSQLSQVLNGGSAITKDFVKNNAGELGGFHTAEFLLFGNGIHSNTQPVANLTDRGLLYLTLVVDVMIEDIDVLVGSWETSWKFDPQNNPNQLPYAELLANPGVSEIYTEPVDVYLALVDGMKGIVTEVAATKIGASFGANSGSVDLEKEESPYSWNSLADFHDNVRSVWNVYTGEYRGVDQGDGLKQYLLTKDPELAQRVEDKIADTMARIRNISGAEGITYREAITNDAYRGRVQDAINGLNELFDLLDQDVTQAIIH